MRSWLTKKLTSKRVVEKNNKKYIFYIYIKTQHALLSAKHTVQVASYEMSILNKAETKM